MRAARCAALALVALAGCETIHEWCGEDQKHKPCPPTFSYYHLDAFRWEAVDRVLVLPALNESPYTNAGDEVRVALNSELQQLGRFEVVDAPPDDRAELARKIHRLGRFDEGVMLEIGFKTRADVVVHATVTQYSPYPRPRLGLILQAVGPREAKVVASVDGLWDTTDVCVSERLRAYYQRRKHARWPWPQNNVIAGEETFAEDLALESPALFQRFVTHEAVLALLGLPVPGVAGGDPAGPIVVAGPEKPAKDKAAKEKPMGKTPAAN